MAHTAIQNVKILHKRYSASEWLAGKTNGGNSLSLANGELGYDTTNGVLKIGTVDGSTWANAKEVRKQTTEYRYKSGETYVTAAPDTVETWFISKIEYEKIISGGIDQQCYKLVIYHDDLEAYVDGRIDANVNIPDLKVTDGSATASEGEIVVVTSIEEGAEHEVVSKKGLAATKSYVDTKFSTTRLIDVVDDTTSLEEDSVSSISEGQELEVTYVANVKESTADHTIELDKRKLIIPSVTIDDSQTGDYISDISIDSQDSHKIKVTRTNLPSITTGDGSGNGNGATIVGGISATGHTVTAAKKTIKGDGKVISVAGTNADITISADTYTKAEIDELHEAFETAIDELGKSMEFAGTLASDGTGTVRTLPTASDNTIGHVYKVAVAGTYNSKACKVGDMFICDNSKVWRYIPSGDETFTDTWRGIQVNGIQVKDNSIGGGDINFAAGDGVTVNHSSGTITVAHSDTSDIEDLSKAARTYVDGLTFDEYGHVTGYTVGTEIDQEIPNQIQGASGGETAASLEFISQATLSKDNNNDIVLTTDTKKVAATDKINVAENGNTVTFKHDAISTTTAADTSKNVTITAGSDQKTFTVVDSVTGDGFGHITDVKTKTVTVEVPEYVDTNTTYELGAEANGSTKADIVLAGSDNTEDKVTVAAGDGLGIKVSGDEITLSGKVAADILGMIKAHLVTAGEANAEAATLPSIDNSVTDRFYQVNVKADGTAFVQVPWKNTEYTGSNGVKLVGNDFQHATSVSDGSKAVDMYAFGTDAYGHITGAVAVTTLDGNVD